jgi:hypothetical protein
MVTQSVCLCARRVQGWREKRRGVWLCGDISLLFALSDMQIDMVKMPKNDMNAFHHSCTDKIPTTAMAILDPRLLFLP